MTSAAAVIAVAANAGGRSPQPHQLILSDAYQPGWFKDAGLLTVPRQATQVATAAGELPRETKASTPSGIVAALTDRLKPLGD